MSTKTSSQRDHSNKKRGYHKIRLQILNDFDKGYVNFLIKVVLVILIYNVHCVIRLFDQINYLVPVLLY